MFSTDVGPREARRQWRPTGLEVRDATPYQLIHWFATTLALQETHRKRSAIGYDLEALENQNGVIEPHKYRRETRNAIRAARRAYDAWWYEMWL